MSTSPSSVSARAKSSNSSSRTLKVVRRRGIDELAAVDALRRRNLAVQPTNLKYSTTAKVLQDTQSLSGTNHVRTLSSSPQWRHDTYPGKEAGGVVYGALALAVGAGYLTQKSFGNELTVDGESLHRNIHHNVIEDDMECHQVPPRTSKLYELFNPSLLGNYEYDSVGTFLKLGEDDLDKDAKNISSDNETKVKDLKRKDNPLQYQQNSVASSATLSNGVLEAVEASVHQAQTWEKNAMAAVVDKLKGPRRYETCVRALKGGRLAMEDTYVIHDGGRFTGVFDGHGGAAVSKYIQQVLYHKIKTNIRLEEGGIVTHSSLPLSSVVKSIGSAFDEIEDEILSNDDLQYQGSTAVAVYLHEDSQTSERTIISANVGDSRAVLSRRFNAVDLTRDHKPDDELEKQRIQSMGETVEWDPYAQVSRVKNLSLSRAIGDRYAKPVVSGEVDIKLFPIGNNNDNDENDDDDFIILASDGLWDVFTSQDCVSFVQKKLYPTEKEAQLLSPEEAKRYRITRRQNMSRAIANEASRRGSYDNISVVIVWLNDVKGRK